MRANAGVDHRGDDRCRAGGDIPRRRQIDAALGVEIALLLRIQRVVRHQHRAQEAIGFGVGDLRILHQLLRDEASRLGGGGADGGGVRGARLHDDDVRATRHRTQVGERAARPAPDGRQTRLQVGRRCAQLDDESFAGDRGTGRGPDRLIGRATGDGDRRRDGGQGRRRREDRTKDATRGVEGKERIHQPPHGFEGELSGPRPVGRLWILARPPPATCRWTAHERITPARGLSGARRAPPMIGGRGRRHIDFDTTQLGTDTVLPLTVMALAAVGVVTNVGTLVAVIAGADPATPPRGVVRTTCEPGSAVPLLRFA